MYRKIFNTILYNYRSLKSLPIIIILFAANHELSAAIHHRTPIIRCNSSAILDQETQDLLMLCEHLAHCVQSRPAEKLIGLTNRAQKTSVRLSMRDIIRIVRYAVMTLKICEARHDLPIERIQKIAELLSQYWSAIWERWLQKNVYPVDLKKLARLVETQHA